MANSDGTFAVDFAKIKPAVRDLDHELLTIEATGDYATGKAMLDRLARVGMTAGAAVAMVVRA